MSHLASSHLKALRQKNGGRGFTLLELLLVVAAIAILATIVFAVLSPATTLNKFRDSNRLSNVQAILNAMSLYAIDNSGNVPNVTDPLWVQDATIPLCGNADHRASGTSTCLDLTDLTDASAYLLEVPSDPSATNPSNDSGYTASIDVNGVVTINAPSASTGATSVQAKGKFNPLP